MFTDFILNGSANGEVATQLGQCRFDPGLMRPYLNRKGQPCVTVNTGRFDEEGKPIFKQMLSTELIANGVPIPVSNATTLRKDEWIKMDQVVIKSARSRLRAWADLAASNTYGGFNGMAHTMLEHETMSDPGEASVDMDGLTDDRNDAPKFQLEGLPLPITHSGFRFSSRKLAMSRNGGMPIDMTMAEAAGRRVAETIEQTTIGTLAGMTFGTAANYGTTPTVYGYTNHPSRVTKTDLTTPTGSNASTTVGEVLTMIQLAAAQFFYGPFMLYHSTDWDRYMDDDYSSSKGDNTLRDRLRKIEVIRDVRRLDSLTDTFTLLLVQMTGDVARAVVGMDITTVQWQSKGGLQLDFKVMGILVPQLRADQSGNCGIVHGTTS